jgi:glutamine synthetase
MLRRAAVGVAALHGQRATFMAKPYARQPGSGLHVHVSLLDNAGDAIFAGRDGQAVLGHAVGGMQRLHAQSMALFAPNFSAYRRYRSGAFVADGSSWAEDDRSAAFRIPHGPRRIEHRVAGADASPHLTMAAILAAAHHGITRKLTPTPAKARNARAADETRLPDDIFSALRAFEQPGVLHEYLPQEFPALFAALRRAEARDLLEEVQPIEHEFYL